MFLLLSNLLKTPDKYLNQDSKRRSDWPGCELNEVQKKRILCDFQYYTLFNYTASPLCLRRKHSAEKRISHLSLDWPWALVKLNSHSIPPQNCQTLNHTLSLLVFTKFEEWYGIVVLFKLQLQASLKTVPAQRKKKYYIPNFTLLLKSAFGLRCWALWELSAPGQKNYSDLNKYLVFCLSTIGGEELGDVAFMWNSHIKYEEIACPPEVTW